jgi:hypothetical protein
VGETKSRLITAAFVAALAVSAVCGAGAAGASTGTGAQLCADQTCVYQPNYQNYPLTIPYTDGTAKYVLQVTTAQKHCTPGKSYWTGAYFAPNGTREASTSTAGCVARGKGTPAGATGSVTRISLPATYNPSGYFTCLDFTYTVKGLAYGIFLLSSPASPGTWVQNNIANCAPGSGITP